MKSIQLQSICSVSSLPFVEYRSMSNDAAPASVDSRTFVLDHHAYDAKSLGRETADAAEG